MTAHDPLADSLAEVLFDKFAESDIHTGTAVLFGDLARAAREHIEKPIRALHTPGEQYVEPNGGATLTRCEGCDDDYPCPTIRALGGTDG